MKRCCTVFWLCVFLLFSNAAFSQTLGGLLKKAQKTLNKTGSFKPGTAVSTSLKDSLPSIAFLQDIDFDPASADSIRSFELKPGYYRATIRSYCLHAGAYSPSSGEGYQLCKFKGSKTDMIQHILKESAAHPDIPQRDVQVLIWGIESGARFSDYPPDFQARVKPILRAGDIAAMEVKMDLVVDKLMPESIRSLAETYRSFRNELASGEMEYDKLAAIAVKSGLPPVGLEHKDIRKGTWSYIGDGFFLRVYPQSYPTSDVELYRPAYLEMQKDDHGRITNISKGDNKIAIEYDDAPGQNVIHTTGGHDVPVWRIKQVVFRGASPEQTYTVKDAGWIFRGSAEESSAAAEALQQGGAAASGPSAQDKGGVSDESIINTLKKLELRWKQAKKLFDRWQDLEAGINEGYDATHRRPADYYLNEEYANLQVNDALKTALNPLDFKGKHRWLFEHFMMIRDLSYYITCMLAGNCDEGNDPKEPPISDYIAQRGNSGMQRLGLSPYTK